VYIHPWVNKGVNILPRGQISPLGARGEVKYGPQVSDRNVTTNFGKTEFEEMCVLLLAVYVDPNSSQLPSSWLSDCWSGNWNAFFTNIPPDSAVLN
jgi:hypothetical protein